MNQLRKIIRESLNENLSFKYHNYGLGHGYDSGRIELYKDKKEIVKSDFSFYDDIFKKFDLYSEEVLVDKIEDEKSLYITGIEVKEDYRGKGYGEMVVKKIEEYAKGKGAKYITLGSITSALGFWRSMGFKVYSIGNFYNMYKKI
jgi:ribosomal protein S18 acetylase RimI-like enzyme